MHTDVGRGLQAETLLHELATKLRGLPFEESTRVLHLRALALKRAITGWRDREPDDAELAAVCDEIRTLLRALPDVYERVRGGCA